MSNLLKTLKEDITESVKSGNTTKRNILKVVVGEAEMTALRQNKEVSDEVIFATIKKVIEGNTTTLSSLRYDDNQRRLTLIAENNILGLYLPKVLTLDETVGYLLPIKNELTAAKNIGIATGLAMKTLKSANLAVDSKIVIEALNAIRG